MISWILGKRLSPIGVDIGSRSVKLVQLDADRTTLHELVRWELPEDAEKTPESRKKAIVAALVAAQQGRDFRGNDAVLCLGPRDLYLQNIRVPKLSGPELERQIHQEIAGRLPFPVAETEIRYLEAADVRQGEAVLREVIVLACHRPVLQQLLDAVEEAGLRPVGVDAEPIALLRAYFKQYRRDEDRKQRVMYVHIGQLRTNVVVAEGETILFLKYVDIGGKQLDEAVARHLKMPAADAAALRRNNGDRRSDMQNPEITRSVADAVRPVMERLASEVSLCIRYHSVTFRGQPLVRLVLGGGEASTTLTDFLGKRLDLKCEVGEPLRTITTPQKPTREAQWDVATGLALWEAV